MRTVLICLNAVKERNIDQMIAIAKSLNKVDPVHVNAALVAPAIDIYPSAGMAVASQIDDSHRRFFLDSADEVKARFGKAMDAEGISWEWDQVDSPTTLIADGVLERALTSDLVVIPQSRVDDAELIEDEMAERVVMESGRPVLVVPYFGEYEDIGARPVVAWNGTREAARAAFDAIGLFQKNADVKISWMNANRDHKGIDLPGAELATVMARHGFKATAEMIPTGDLPVGETMLSHVADVDADLLVLGAYGHSRMREFIFGGVTRTFLESMTVPVLMSH